MFEKCLCGVQSVLYLLRCGVVKMHTRQSSAQTLHGGDVEFLFESLEKISDLILISVKRTSSINIVFKYVFNKIGLVFLFIYLSSNFYWLIYIL